MEVRYYADDDAEIVYASLGEMALEGLLRIATPLTGSSTWEWIARQSSNWDAVHQKIYRNFRVTALDEAESGALPPLPDPTTKPKWQPLATTVECSRYPSLTTMLRTLPGSSADFVVVLSEDTYESFFGDGKFLHFSSLGRTEDEARKNIVEADSTYTKYHVRQLRLNLECDLIRGDLQKEVFDPCSFKEVCNAANRLAATIESTPR